MTSSSTEGNARRWYVTGACSGIGRAIIERALADGDAVIANVQKPQALNDLQSLFPRTLEVEPLDVRDRGAISATVKRVLRHGPVDIVVNNAGYGAVGAAEELTSGHVDDQLQTLLHGPIAITREFLLALCRFDARRPGDRPPSKRVSERLLAGSGRVPCPPYSFA